MLLSPGLSSSSQSPVPADWQLWHDMSRPRVKAPVKMLQCLRAHGWADDSCTDPSPGPQSKLHPPPSLGKAFFAEHKGTGKKEHLKLYIISCFVKGLGHCFLESFYSSVSIFKTIRGVICSENPKTPIYKGALGRSMQQKEDVLSG